MSEPIIYSQLNNNFSQISNFALLDVTLSCKAYKLYSYMCYRIGLSDKWQFNKFEILKHFKEGESAMRSAFGELIEAGFLERKRIRNAKGIFGKTDYIIYAKPITKGSSPQVENPHVDNPQMEKPHEESSRVEKPQVENQPYNNKEGINKDSNNKDLSLSKNPKLRTLEECIAHAEKEKYPIDVPKFHKYYYGDPEDPPKMGMAKLMMSWASKPENQVVKESFTASSKIAPTESQEILQIRHEIKSLITRSGEMQDNLIFVSAPIEKTSSGFVIKVEDERALKYEEVLEKIKVKIEVK